ncbi:MAG TPA: NAD(P)H-binding protein, partial [Acidimicrobiales bacterium]|nr:NAD(P)H-binding protein [Acidimicrobiales bacterium]
MTTAPPAARVREVLVLGATGYVGGRLVSELLDAGHRVRVLSRSPGRAERFEWSGRVRLFTGDVLDAGTLGRAFDGCDAVYYLVHSIGTSGDFAATEAIAALNVRDAADAAGCRRIVYLGGMGRGDELSAHLASRHRVGAILASGSTPTTELRAAVIIGAGSISFEMLRYLTEVLPAMVTPRWVRTKCQPIAIRDVLRYLVAALDDPETV